MKYQEAKKLMEDAWKRFDFKEIERIQDQFVHEATDSGCSTIQVPMISVPSRFFKTEDMTGEEG